MLTRKGENCGPRSHKLPPPGAIVTVVGLATNPRALAVVESYPLCTGTKNGPRFWSRGVHLCRVRFLRSGARASVAWQYLQEVDWTGAPAGESERGSYSSYSDIPRHRREVLGHKARRRLEAIRQDRAEVVAEVAHRAA